MLLLVILMLLDSWNLNKIDRMHIEALEQRICKDEYNKEYNTYDNTYITARKIQKEIKRMSRKQRDDFI